MKDINNDQVDRTFINVSYIVIGFAMAFLGMVAYWSLESTTIMSGDDRKIVLVDKEAKAGDFVKVKLTYCKEIEEPVLFTRSFVANSVVISNPTLVEPAGKGCVKDRLVTIPVPPQIGTGEYRIRYTLEAEINPIKTAHEQYWSDPVRIIGKEQQ